MTLKLSPFVGGAVLCALPVLVACGGRGLPAPPEPEPPATGASTTIRPSSIPSGSLSLRDLLQGKASGLEFITGADGSERMQIRGISTIGSGQQNPQPLVLVDNIEVPSNQLSSALAGLTRDDIRKVDVLKDVASTSSYGMRGAGGVILITTTRR
jgi:TonB-dependent SusC/RagA subfamily outer membrane receptor